MAKRKKLKPRARRILIGILIALIAICSVLGYIVYSEFTYRFSAAIQKDGIVKIDPSMTFSAAASMLENEGFIASAEKMTRTAIKHERDSVQTGNYKLGKGDSYRTLLNQLYYGRQTPVRVTFNNIRTLDRLAGAVSRYTLADSTSMLAHFRAEAEKSGERVNYIARFIPNTYEVYWTITPEEFSAKMKEESDKFWNSKNRKQRAADLGFTPEEVTTLASIVIEETKVEREMSDVAGVYINRIGKGIPLQADPTVKFAVGDFSIKRVLNRHLEYPSPYNTYKNTGLPPGPICAPPIAAIDAVLDYADKRHNYLYFCANADFSGSHSFAATLAEHNRNAEVYHRELNRRNIR